MHGSKENAWNCRGALLHCPCDEAVAVLDTLTPLPLQLLSIVQCDTLCRAGHGVCRVEAADAHGVLGPGQRVLCAASPRRRALLCQ